MVVRFLCKCGKSLKAPDEYIGKKVSCTKCGDVLKVPDTDQAPEEKKKSKSAAKKSFRSHELNLPPLSEVRKPEEVMAEKSTPAELKESASSNIAQQLLRPSEPTEPEQSNIESEQPVENAPMTPKPSPPPAKRKTGMKHFGEEKKSKKIDHAKEANKYYAKMILAGGAGVIVVCYGLYSLMYAMVSTADRPPLVEVNGIVTLDDKPLVGAEVTFEPQDEWKDGKKPSRSRGVTDEQGRFSLIYLKDQKGATIGEHLVRIMPYDHKQPVPAIYNVSSVLKYEVKKGGEPPDFKLISK